MKPEKPINPNQNKKPEVIDKPDHYTAYRLESIDIIEALGLGRGFNLGNVLKYVYRAGLKGGPEKQIEDLKKAAWYLNREIERISNAS